MAKWQDTLKAIKKLTEVIQRSSVLIIDPSSGGGASKPGWALIKQGELKFSGILDVPAHLTLQERLYAIRVGMEELVENYVEGALGLLVVEEIRIIPGTFSGPSVANLLKGVGVAMCAVPSAYYLEIPPMQWKRFAVADPAYTKSDEEDAIYMAKFLLHLVSEDRKTNDEIPIRKAPSNRKVKLCPKPKKKSSRASRPTSSPAKSKSRR